MVTAGGFFLLEGGFSFPLSPKACSRGVVWLLRLSQCHCRVAALTWLLLWFINESELNVSWNIRASEFLQLVVKSFSNSTFLSGKWIILFNLHLFVTYITEPVDLHYVHLIIGFHLKNYGIFLKVGFSGTCETINNC